MARIALVTSSFLPRQGGVEEHVANVAIQLRGLGHEVVIWSVDRGDEVTESYDGIRLRYLPTPLPARRLSSLARFTLRFPGAVLAWVRAFRMDRPDFLHIHCFGPNGIYGTLLSVASRRPLVFSHHGETFGDANGVFDQSALLRRALAVALRRAVVTTSCSLYAARDLERFGVAPESVEVVYNGINLDEAQDGSVPLPPRYFLSIGRLVANKGFDKLIAAFAQVCDHPAFDGTHLVIGGSGPELCTLQELAKSLAISSRVHFVGSLSRTQVGSAMKKSIALVVPSLVEAFGITILEGWRAGVPVVATNRGGPPEFVADGETGLLVDPCDVAALSRRLYQLAEDPALRQRLGSGGAAAVLPFTWFETARRYDQLYARSGLTSPNAAPRTGSNARVHAQ